jgi:replication factor A1
VGDNSLEGAIQDKRCGEGEELCKEDCQGKEVRLYLTFSILILTELPTKICTLKHPIGKPIPYEEVGEGEYPEVNWEVNPEDVAPEKEEEEEEKQTVEDENSEDEEHGPVTKKTHMKNNFDRLAEVKQDWLNSYKHDDADLDLVKSTKNYYKTTSDNIYTPLKSLTPYAHDWKIRVRVVKKFPKREWKNARASGSLLNIHLVDWDGTKINATFFNQAADLFDQEVMEDKVYLMSNGMVKVANKKYSIIDNDFWLNFDRNAEIIEVDDDDTIHDTSYNFKTIKEIQEMPENSIVDFLGVVHNVGAINTIQLKNGNDKERRLMLVTDDSGLIINLSFWGKNARKTQLEGNPIIGVKGAKLSSYGGKSLNAPENSNILINPDMPRAKELEEWYINLSSNSLKSLSLDSKSTENHRNNERLIYELPGFLEHEFWEKGVDKNIYFVVNGYVNYVKNDERNVYHSCPEETWKRKVKFNDYKRKWYWEWCQLDYAVCKPTYVCQVKFMDLSDSFFISFYRDMANELIGVSAEEILKLRSEQQFHKVSEIFGDWAFKNLKILVKARKQVFNNEPKVVFFATRVYPYSFIQDNEVLLERLKMYKNKLDLVQ